MSTDPTRRSAPTLSEAKRHLVIPDGIATTGWPSVEAQLHRMGVVFDPWQVGLTKAMLGKRADGKYAATIGGVTLSIPRQVGKTFTIGSLAFALCALFPRSLMLWTAHHSRTSSETFKSMLGMARRQRVAPFIEQTLRGSGVEAVIFKNESRILFGARENGFGRGFSAVDMLIFDEAQILTGKALDDMVPATNQTKWDAGALLFFIGTPPRPGIDPGEVFSGKRSKALSGKGKDMLYLELGADPDANPDDWAQVAKANPSFPKRTPRESILRMRENLPDVESYMREGLGIWDDDDSGGFFSPGKWAGGFNAKAPSRIVGDLALGVAVSVDRKRAVIGAAGRNEAGSVHFEPVWFGSPAACPAEAKRLAEKHSAVAVAIAGAGPGADLVPSLELVVPASVLRVMKTDDEKTAAGEVYDLVEGVGHAHLDDADLNGAVRAAVRKDVGDRFVIGRRKSSADVSAFEAVAYAAWALGRHKTYNVLDSVL